MTNLNQTMYEEILKKVVDQTNLMLKKYSVGEYISYTYYIGDGDDRTRYLKIIKISYGVLEISFFKGVHFQSKPELYVEDIETGEKYNMLRFDQGGEYTSYGRKQYNMPEAEPFCRAVWKWDKNYSGYYTKGHYSLCGYEPARVLIKMDNIDVLKRLTLIKQELERQKEEERKRQQQAMAREKANSEISSEDIKALMNDISKLRSI